MPADALLTSPFCSRLRTCSVKKLPPGFRGRSEWMAVNTEWGEFRSPALPLAEEDLWIDCSSPNPGEAGGAGGGSATVR